MLAQKEYKGRQDSIARLVHWNVCCKYDMNRSEKWYEHQSALINSKGESGRSNESTENG